MIRARGQPLVSCSGLFPELSRRGSSAWSESPSGPPVECVGDVGKALGQGGQVPVIYPPGIQRGGELGQCRWPCRALGECGDGYFLNDGDDSVDLYDPVDDVDGGAPGGGGTSEFPGPVATRGRALLGGPTPGREQDGRSAPATRQGLSRAPRRPGRGVIGGSDGVGGGALVVGVHARTPSCLFRANDLSDWSVQEV